MDAATLDGIAGRGLMVEMPSGHLREIRGRSGGRMSTPAESAARVKESLEQAAKALSAHYGREVRPRFHEAARQFGQGAPAFAKVIEPLRRLSGVREA